MKTVIRRLISVALSLAVILTMIPVQAFAGRTTDTEDPPSDVVTSYLEERKEQQEEQEPVCTAKSSGTEIEPISAISTSGLVYNEADYSYTINDNTKTTTITKYAGADTAIQIPSELGGYPVTAISSNVFKGNATLKTVSLPETLTSIGSFAFSGCSEISSMELPDSVEVIGGYAFADCTKLSNIKIPLSWKSATANGYSGQIFKGCSSLTSITVPEGITALPAYAFEGAAYLERITLPSTLESIGARAFEGCSSITNVILPETLTSIGSFAFSGCSEISSMELPDSVEVIGGYAFADCTKLSNIKIPLSWKSATANGYSGQIFKGCSSLTSITVPEGITALPAYAFEGAAYLEQITLPSTLKSIGVRAFEGCSSITNVILPETLTSIGASAFSGCDVLQYVLVSNPDCIIEQNVFRDSPKVVLCCDMDSFATIYAIDNNIPYTVSDAGNGTHTGILDRSASNYFADVNGINSNGYISFTIDYSVSQDDWTTVSGKSVVIKVPVNTELVERTLRINDTICTDYDYNVDKHTITIPVTKEITSIKYSAKVVEDGTLMSYALLSYTKDRIKKQEVIGVIHESMEVFTVYTTELTSSRDITVEGVAPANSTVSIYVDNVPVATSKANKAGLYFTDVSLPGTSSEQIYVVSAKCETEAHETLSESRVVSFRQEAPTLTGFKFYVDSDESQMVDLYAYASQGIRPSITHTGSRHPYRFQVTFTNPEVIDTVYVTSTRSNIKKSIPAVYDESTGTFIASGHFDEANKLYVPGTLGVEYNLKHKDALVGDRVDWDMLTEHLSDELVNGAVVNSTATATGSYGTIDLTGVREDFADVILEYSVGMYDEATGSSLSDLVTMAGVLENVFAYTIPGVDDSKYYAVLDLRDPKTMTMIVADVTDTADTAVQFWISAQEANGVSLDYNFYDLSDQLSHLSTAAGVLYKTYGIYEDYNDLCDEIMQSSTIENKQEALVKAGELRTDQMAFMLMTTILPLIVAGGPMAAPAVMFSAIIGTMVAASDVFWQLRVMPIKGESYCIKWHIDPSGYVYDLETGERIQGVTATAYCVEYDGSDTFWDQVPDAAEYGTLWNALEYSQANPLITDAKGRYAWDVPEGWWRVKYEKEGYETTWSEWLPVPPPQTEVNIGMKAIETSEYRFKLGDTTDTSASVTLTNTTQDALTAVYVLAAYDADGKLLDSTSMTDELAAQESTTLSVSCEEDETIALIKGYVLDENTYAPLTSVWSRVCS